MRHLRTISSVGTKSGLVKVATTEAKDCNELAQTLKVLNYIAPLPGFNTLYPLITTYCTLKQPKGGEEQQG
nr:hypothetical protein [Bacillota bacterium]